MGQEIDLSLYGILLDAIPSEANFSTLDWAVTKIRQQFPEKPIWYEADNRVITADDIYALANKGWEVQLDTLDPSSGFVITEPVKIILISDIDTGYIRDKVLFHELCHIIYTSQQLIDLHSSEGDVGHRQNNFIAEWLGRQLRADPSLLKAAVYGFNLKPFIYDRISFIAFSDEPYHHDLQIPLPGLKEYTASLAINQTFVD